MDNREKEILLNRIEQLEREKEKLRSQGQEVYSDLIHLGSIVHRLVDLIGLEEFISKTEKAGKLNMMSLISKKVGGLMLEGNVKEKFGFLNDLLPLNEKYEVQIKLYIEAMNQNQVRG